MNKKIVSLVQDIIRWVNFGSPVVDLLIRLYVGKVFFMAGLTKIASWSTTLMLFENEYAVPLLSPAVAAWMGTAAELSLPVLLALGLATRPAVFALFIFNIVAVVSYPDISDAGIKDHVFWGFLMLVTFFHGPGAISVDHLLRRRFGTRPS
ncbi:MAG: DoxX family protein [Burkholderiales bacterium]